MGVLADILQKKRNEPIEICTGLEINTNGKSEGVRRVIDATGVSRQRQGVSILCPSSSRFSIKRSLWASIGLFGPVYMGVVRNYFGPHV